MSAGKHLPSGNTTLDSRQETAESVLGIVRSVVLEMHPEQTDLRVSLDSVLDRDLGIDSLGRVELVTRIERDLKVSLPKDTFAIVETPGDLLRAMEGASGMEALPVDVRLEIAGRDVIDVPKEASNLIEAFDWHADNNPDRTHIHFYDEDGENRSITYQGLRTAAREVAAGMQRKGVEPGDRVAIMLPTGRDYFVTFMGISLAGAIPVPIYPPVRRDQIADHLKLQANILGNCRPSMLVTVPEAKILAQLLKSRVESLEWISTPEELRQADGIYVETRPRPEDVAFLQYTSGSTGNPKGVVLTHANLLANIRVDGEGVGAASSDVFVSWLPLYHDMGLIGAWFGSLYFAVPLVIMSPLTFLGRPQRWLWAIHQYGGTLSAAPNFAYQLCLSKIRDEDIEGLDLRSWRIALNGAEAINPTTVEGFIRRFEPYGFSPETMFPVYGLAESTVGLAFPPERRPPVFDRIQRDPLLRDGEARIAEESDDTAMRFAACGVPLPNHEIRIVDELGRELPPRRQGRIQFRGPSTTRGYFGNPDATEALFDGDWVESGDLGYIANDEIHITGRRKDLIIRAGRNVYPEELETAISAMPDVRTGRVVVFGSPDPESGTERLVVMAETRLRDQTRRSALRSAIVTHATTLVGMPPDDVVLAAPGTVLKTSSGKLRRNDSRRIYEEGDTGKGAATPAWWRFTELAMESMGPIARRLGRQISASVYALWCWSLFLLLGSLTWLGVMLAPRESWRWTVMRWGTRGFARLSLIPIAVSGTENLPREMPCVVTVNHQSYLDVIMLIAALPMEVSFVAKTELQKLPPLKWFLERIGTVFVERFDQEQAARDAERIEDLARSGRSLLFFPEGTFTRAPGLLPFRMGAFTVAARAGRPVVPVMLDGTRGILRDTSWFPRRGRVEIHIDFAIDPESPDSASTWHAALALKTRSRAAIERLLKQRAAC